MRVLSFFRSTRLALSLTAFALLAACQAVPPVAPPPVAPPPPPPPPVQLPPPPVAVEPEKPWDVAAVIPGSWSYRQDATGSLAAFGFPNGAPSLTIRCISARREIELLIPGSNTQSTVTLRTSAGNLAWPGGPSTDGSVTLRIARGASDVGFDWIAFSRGRMSVEVPGRPRLLVPVWAEVSRVIEDCRR